MAYSISSCFKIVRTRIRQRRHNFQKLVIRRKLSPAPGRSATPPHYSSRASCASCACPKFGIDQETARSTPLLFLQERQERFVAIVFHSFDRNEMEGGRVDGVALARRRSRVGKEMAEVSIGALGADLSALTAVRRVHFLEGEVYADVHGR